MSNNFRSMHYGCTVYGDATLAVESGITGAVSFEIQNSEGDQIAAVMLDQAHVKRMIAQLQSMVSDVHPSNARSEKCADAAWYLARFFGEWTGMRPDRVRDFLERASPSRLICDAESIQMQRRGIADNFRDGMVGRLVHAPMGNGLYETEWIR